MEEGPTSRCECAPLRKEPPGRWGAVQGVASEGAEGGGVPAWFMGLAGQLCVLGPEPWFGALSARSGIWQFFVLALGSFAGVWLVGRPVPERP